MKKLSERAEEIAKANFTNLRSSQIYSVLSALDEYQVETETRIKRLEKRVDKMIAADRQFAKDARGSSKT